MSTARGQNLKTQNSLGKAQKSGMELPASISLSAKIHNLALISLAHGLSAGFSVDYKLDFTPVLFIIASSKEEWRRCKDRFAKSG